MSHGYITEAEMRELLRDAYARDPEKSFLAKVGRNVSDPAMPRDANNRRRIHPLWLTLGLVSLFVMAVFLYFSFVQ
jgi:hypothetical protein